MHVTQVLLLTEEVKIKKCQKALILVKSERTILSNKETKNSNLLGQ